jgi:hypothetical protein
MWGLERAVDYNSSPVIGLTKGGGRSAASVGELG